jgi:hypothetical protein
LAAQGPGTTCVTAQAPPFNNSGYSLWLGDSADYNQTTNADLYNTSAPHWSAWAGWPCASTQAAMCEVPAQIAFGSCPAVPPAAPPPATQPGTGLCLPPNDAAVYCPNTRPGNSSATGTPSCYLLNATAATFATHQAACQAMGGYLAAFNSAHEQLDVEVKLQLWTYTGSNIWLGVHPSAGAQWFLADGTHIGNGQPSNSAPYAHW